MHARTHARTHVRAHPHTHTHTLTLTLTLTLALTLALALALARFAFTLKLTLRLTLTLTLTLGGCRADDGRRSIWRQQLGATQRKRDVGSCCTGCAGIAARVQEAEVRLLGAESYFG